ncbi:hypothetical protein AMJ80_12175 [bacterium SM23_31]|nr:MAG: hypothetical protein AMJ80_12175 [bacterium SM23_31]
MKKTLFVILVIAFAVSTTFGQETGKKKITRDTFKLPSWGSYRLSPDNTKIAFTKRDRDDKGELTTSHIFIYELTTRKMMHLTNSERGETAPRWLSNDRLMFPSDRGGGTKWWVISLSGGEAMLFFEDTEARNSGTLSEDLKKVLYTKRTERPDKKEWDEKVEKKDDAYYTDLPPTTFTHLWVYNSDKKEHKQITTGNFDNSGGAWSPDGRWVAFTSNRTGTRTNDPNTSNDSNIWVVPSDSGAQRQLTTNPGPDRGPVFSPDGGFIAYTGSIHENSSADQTDIWVIPFEGGKALNLTKDFDYSTSSPQWSPDGKTIYFTASKGVSSHLYKVSPSGGYITMVFTDNEYVYSRFTMSEDGTKWVFTGSSLYETDEVFMANIDGSNIRNILSPNNHLGEFEIAESEVLTWKGADYWDIDGILTYPLNYEPGKKYPLILQIHGGPHSRYSKTFNSSSQIWAARGYAVLRSNPRGSSGRTFEFSNGNYMDWGGKDYIDIMKGVDHVIDMGVADPDKMVVMGGSYGGFMTFWVVTQTDRFKAAIGHAGISDWFSFFGQTDIPNLLKFGFGGMPYQTKETYEKYSPIEYVENVTTPLLITHGESDRRVPISQAEQYFVSLRKLGTDVKFLRFPREGHGIREEAHTAFLEEEQVKWFEKYIFPEKYAERMKKEADIKKE